MPGALFHPTLGNAAICVPEVDGDDNDGGDGNDGDGNDGDDGNDFDGNDGDDGNDVDDDNW